MSLQNNSNRAYGAHLQDKSPEFFPLRGNIFFANVKSSFFPETELKGSVFPNAPTCNLATIVVVVCLLLLLLLLPLLCCCCCCCSFCCAWPADPQLGYRASQPWRLTSRPQGKLARPLNQPAMFKGNGYENCPFLSSWALF